MRCNIDPYTKETTKVAELKDQYGTTRFKVVLTDVDENTDNLTTWDRTYNVQVVSYCVKDTSDPIILIHLTFEDYDQATTAFYKYVNQYRILLNVETKGWQDILIYKDKIGFKIPDPPPCCKNCMYSKLVSLQNCLFLNWKKHHARLICTLPLIAKTTKEIVPEEINVNSDQYYNSENVCVQLDTSPLTYENGICNYHVFKRDLKYKAGNGYETETSEYDPRLDLHMETFIEHECKRNDYVTDQELKFEVNRRVNNTVSNIKIASITGNDDTTDNNNNGIPDEAENIIGYTDGAL